MSDKPNPITSEKLAEWARAAALEDDDMPASTGGFYDSCRRTIKKLNEAIDRSDWEEVDRLYEMVQSWHPNTLRRLGLIKG